MASAEFPVFDLGRVESSGPGERRAIGKQVDEICRSTGFLAVRNHGASEEVIDVVWNAAHDFFDLPPEAKEKEKVRAPYAGFSRTGMRKSPACRPA